ncbi:ABC transporter ATP-binding protein/permease [Paenibacillus sp. N3/727]|uniref:ABC transporter ATP-binding protein n=1 Tax=Paenibacillus sp. N3/727 TaxID=2925845 RepID=UPI001F53D89B|nr:ABC transporter ATP-binding protein [Paenibacillus sp. N3/727]UNK17245.1 ABC transporter ATP-binding protein/permease [Paenibacillus sp. N3/727]
MENDSNNKATISLKQKKKVVLGVFYRLMPLIFKIIPGMTASLVLIKILSSLVPILTIFLVKETIDAVTAAFDQQPGALMNTLQLIILQGVLLLLDKILVVIEELITFRAQQHLKYHFEKMLAEQAARLPLYYFDRPDYFDQLERTAMGLDLKGFNIFVLFMRIFRNIVSLVGMFYILISFHWVLAVAVLLMVVPNLWISAYLGQQRYAQMVHQTPTQRKTQYLMLMLHSREAAKELRVHNISQYLLTKWRALFWKTTNESYILRKSASWKTLIVDSVHATLNIISMCLLVWFGYLGSLTVGHYVSLTQALFQMESMIAGLGRSIANVYEESLFMSEVLHYLDLETEGEGDSRTEQFPDKLQGHIEINNLTYTYAGQSTPVLNGINLRIKSGEKIAIVGANGAGKSTFVKCLLGLYMPDEGTIHFDGINIREINLESMRNRVSVVFQDFMKYQLTARENIAMGRLDRLTDDAGIKEAANQSGAGELLSRLPEGLDTELGPMFDGGYELSGGQWQKIALSRAYMKDAQLVILDEPTSALDPKAEAEIYDHFASQYEGKTTIMISHRLSSCRHADRIIVLKDGKIIEEGSHDDLLHKNGQYAEMFLTQAKRYTA